MNIAKFGHELSLLRSNVKVIICKYIHILKFCEIIITFRLTIVSNINTFCNKQPAVALTNYNIPF